MSRITICLALGALIAAASPPEAFAEAEKGGEASMAQQVDTNGDGVISRQELAVFWAERFRRQDIDGSGRITLDEMQARVDPSVAHRVTRRFERLDVNRDGTIDRVEFSVSAKRWFAQMDGNGDGRVTREEMRTRHGRKN